MKAAVYSNYGNHENITLTEVAKPTPKDNHILIKVRAASINASDWEALTGVPLYVRLFDGFQRPSNQILGSDIAGVVEAVGNAVTQFKPGDAVVGETLYLGRGGFAEYICIPERALNHKSEALTFEQAAALPQAAVLALQALRDMHPIQPGEKLLINGAGGGAGSFAIQLAKQMGAEITAVDAAEKFEFMQALGADHLLDYRQTNYTKTGHRYDRIIDFVATRGLAAYRRALNPNGLFLLVGGGMRQVLMGAAFAPLLLKRSSQTVKILAWQHNTKEMTEIQAMCEAGHLTPIVDKCYPFDNIKEAFKFFGTKQAKGKVVITF